jgi:hypothetical protein
MALRGTLDDFGLANVFQIIGQTSKTGTLTARDRDHGEEVKLHFASGNLVRCEASRRQRAELLGTMLRRAEAITEAQLTTALEAQKATHKRLGDCLITLGAMTADELQDFARLQTSETVFRVFLWREGTYEFTATTPPNPNHAPLKAESLLMEGFRQVDEWPAIRKRLTSYATTFDILQNLDVLLATAAASEADSVEAVGKTPADAESFDDFDLGGGSDAHAVAAKGPLQDIEHNERLVYGLIQTGRDVQKLIDLSRLGEFETCRALSRLLGAGIIKVNAPQTQTPAPSAEATVGGIAPRRKSINVGSLISARSLGQGRTVIGLYLGLLLVVTCGLPPWTPHARSPAQFVDLALERAMGRGELARLHEALGVYRALYGSYPQNLEALVQSGLLPRRGLGRTWSEPYAYTRSDQAYMLLAPLR